MNLSALPQTSTRIRHARASLSSLPRTLITSQVFLPDGPSHVVHWDEGSCTCLEFQDSVDFYHVVMLWLWFEMLIYNLMIG